MQAQPTSANTNPTLSGAFKVLDILSELGKTLPFVAPAFVLLKVIIDIETCAKEVDLKCNDLLERVTFMLSHLSVLEKIEVMPSTSKVIDRMNEVLKDAAALIAAYRKQNVITRRLSLTNRDKFMQCADSVNACCSDLLMSLQIYQSKQLETLIQRAVPVDEDDMAARMFVESHGGSIDAVVHDRELVKEFAQQQHLVMDDSVMEQLSANIADSVQQNHERLEGILTENLKTAVSDGLKDIIAELNSAEGEQKFACVQCEKQFTHYTNGPKACSFHQAEYDSWNRQYPCCSTNHPCQFGTHRSKHHCDYPYGSFFPRARGVTGYVDTQEKWATVEDTNLETDASQKASVSQLLRWVSRGAPVQENTLLIIVGLVWYCYPYYFNTFTAKGLEDIAKSVKISKRTLIFRTSDSVDEYAMAEWVLAVSGKITGVRITAKTATSTNPFVRVCPVDLSTCTQSGEVLTLSEGGMRSYTPASSYVLPQMVRYGPTLKDTPTRPVRTNFKTQTSPSLKLIMKTLSDPPLTANPQFVNMNVDFFQGKVSVFNNNPPSTTNPNPITIASVSAQYRFVGEEDYKPVEAFKFIDGIGDLPITIDPRQTWPINFQISVSRSEEDKQQCVRWWDRAYGARKQPLRVKLILEEIEGGQASLVLEYVFRPFPLEKEDEKDLGFVFFDNSVKLERCYVHVQKVEDSGSGVEAGVAKIGGRELNVKKHHQVVYKALKTGKTEIDLEIGQEKNGGEWEWGAWALVDLSCRRVYAFKIILKQGRKVDEAKRRLGCVGYALCPQYGDVIQGMTRPVSYATEVVKLPKLEAYIEEDIPQEDAVDDFRPPIPPKPLTPNLNGVHGSGVSDIAAVAIPAKLTTRLASIDANLTRIADALEMLVVALRPTVAQTR